MVSPGEAAETAALMVFLQPEVPPGLTHQVAAEATWVIVIRDAPIMVSWSIRWFISFSPCAFCGNVGADSRVVTLLPVNDRDGKPIAIGLATPGSRGRFPMTHAEALRREGHQAGFFLVSGRLA